MRATWSIIVARTHLCYMTMTSLQMAVTLRRAVQHLDSEPAKNLVFDTGALVKLRRYGAMRSDRCVWPIRHPSFLSSVSTRPVASAAEAASAYLAHRRRVGL